MPKQRLAIMLLIVFVALFSGGYGIYHWKSSAPPERLVFGTSPGLLEAPIWVAASRGYFRQEGLEVSFEQFPSGRAALRAMLQGRPIDLVSVAPLPFAVESLHRQDFLLIAGIAHSRSNYKLVANRERGIASVADLRGKSVGLPMSSSAQFFLELVLIYNQIAPEEIKMIDMSPATLPDALARGEVDAIAVWEPHANRAEKLLAEKALLLAHPGTIRATLNLVAMKEVARTRPDAILRFLRAVDRGARFIAENTKESAAIVGKLVNLDVEATSTLLNEYTYGLFLDQGLIASFEDEARWATKRLQVDGSALPNFLDLVYFAGLKAIRPEAVTIVGK